MKINRLALRAAVEKTLAKNEADHAEQVKKWEKYKVDYRATWVRENNPGWRNTAKEILKAVEAKEPITKSLFPQDRYSSVRTYESPREGNNRVYGEPTNPGEYRKDRELVALLEVLDLIVDDEITPTGLQGLGITPKTLREAVLKLDSGIRA